MTLRRFLLLSTSIASLSANASQAAPANPTVVSGAVTFANTGNRLTITQSTASAIINWPSFSVAAGEIVQFVQPSTAASILNRVTGAAASALDGLVLANGRLMLVNAKGITVGTAGRVSAASLLLTSSALADADYLAGRSVFTGVPDQGNVTNHGIIEAVGGDQGGGTAILSAPQVSNDGTITAHLGRVVLGAASGFTLDTAGDGLWSYQVTDAAAGALVANAGTLAADGGTVQVSARTLDHAMRDVINTTGMIEARAVQSQGGEIILDGGTQGAITLGPTSLLDASGSTAARISVIGAQTNVAGSLLAPGGFVETSGESLNIGLAHVSAATWLLDPTTLTVDAASGPAIATALASGDVTMTSGGSPSGPGTQSAGAGDINISFPLTWSSNHKLSLNSGNSITVTAAVSATGSGSSIAMSASQDISLKGVLSAAGAVSLSATGSISFLNTTSTGDLTVSGNAVSVYAPLSTGALSLTTTGSSQLTTYASVNASGAATLVGPGTTTLGAPFSAASLTVSASTGALTVNGALSITGTANLAPSGNLSLNGGGSVGGLILNPGGSAYVNAILTDSGNLTASNLAFGQGGAITLSGASPTVSLGGTGYTVLKTASDLQNIADLTANYVLANDLDITGGGIANFVPLGYVGPANTSPTLFSGTLDGLGHVVKNLTISSTTDNTGLFSWVSGTVQNLTLLSAAVSSTGLYTGILAGESQGIINNAGSTGSVTGTDKTGGLVGFIPPAGGTITNAFSMAAISCTSQSGGLVGYVKGTTATVSNSYATGSITETSNAGGLNNFGGLVGVNKGTILNSYATGVVGAGGIKPGNAEGGLVGYMFGSSAVANYSWSSGFVTGVSQVGGLIGANEGTLTSDYYDSTVNTSGALGHNTGTGTGTGLATGAMQGVSLAGLDFINVWQTNAASYPLLRAFKYNLNVVINGATKTYDTANPAFTTGAVTGLALGDSSAVLSAPTLSTTAVATSPIGAYTISASGGSATNALTGYPYVITTSGAPLMVNAAPLTVTANNAGKAYGQTTSFAGTEFTTSGLVNGDSVSTVSLASSGAAAGAAVNSYAINPSAANGSGLTNYSITYSAGTLTVAGAALTITAGNATKTYGQTAPSFTFTTTGLANGDSVSGAAETSAGASTTAAAGSYVITPSSANGSGLANYAITYATGTLTVNPAPLTITAANASKTYGQATPAIGVVTSGLLNTDSVSGATETSAGTAATATVGSYSITPSAATGAGLTNYTITYANATLTVNPAPLTITAANASKTYGQTAPAFGVATSGLVNGDSVTNAAETSAGTTVAATVGSYSITPSAATGTGLSNYAITYADGTLTVTPAPLTITAANASKTYGQAAPALGFATSGLVNTDSVAGATETSAGTTVTATVGSYPINAAAATGTGLSNYAITYQSGTLTVTPAALTITANDANKLAGRNASFAATAFTTSALANSDSVTGVSETSAGAATTAAVGSYSIIPSAATGSGLTNYAITYKSGILTVAALPTSIQITHFDPPPPPPPTPPTPDPPPPTGMGPSPGPSPSPQTSPPSVTNSGNQSGTDVTTASTPPTTTTSGPSTDTNEVASNLTPSKVDANIDNNAGGNANTTAGGGNANTTADSGNATTTTGGGNATTTTGGANATTTNTGGNANTIFTADSGNANTTTTGATTTTSSPDPRQVAINLPPSKVDAIIDNSAGGDTTTPSAATSAGQSSSGGANANGTLTVEAQPATVFTADGSSLVRPGGATPLPASTSSVVPPTVTGSDHQSVTDVATVSTPATTTTEPVTAATSPSTVSPLAPIDLSNVDAIGARVAAGGTALVTVQKNSAELRRTSRATVSQMIPDLVWLMTPNQGDNEPTLDPVNFSILW